MMSKDKTLEIYPVGTKVLLETVEAKITAISIHHNDHVLYEVSHIDKGEKKTQTLEVFEFVVSDDSKKKRIGFL